MEKPTSTPHVSRRAFLAAGTYSTITVMKPSLVRGAQANETVTLGLIGSGGRGTWIGDLFRKTGRFRFVAAADYFKGRVDNAGNRLQVPEAQRYTGLSAYKKLLEVKADAVVIETPPYFHPEQAAASVDAGRHVFLAKPIAVDVPGCLSIAESGKRATARKLVFLVDFQTRANAHYREAVRRVHAGEVGRLVSAEAHYPWQGNVHDVPLTDAHSRLRFWYQTLALSGDVIVEQDIHVLDVATWFINADPLGAVGTGGRCLRKHGAIWDHFSLTYTFPRDFVVTFHSQKAVPGVRDEIRCRVFGSQGVVDTDYFGSVSIRGRKPFEGGSTGNLYLDGAVTNINEFYQAINEKQYDNTTVAPSVRSNLTSVLGRTAAYKDTLVTWKDLLRSGERLEFDTTGLTV